ncbi:MAG: biotin synthase auxiliary protein BsaP [Acidimicrobiales bacterium]
MSNGTSSGLAATQPDAYCPGCGRDITECSGCLPELDPPRYCRQCGKRLTVRVTPTSSLAVCKQHGTVSEHPS